MSNLPAEQKNWGLAQVINDPCGARDEIERLRAVAEGIVTMWVPARHQERTLAKVRGAADVPAERVCKGGGKCPEPMWCGEEQACLWDRWNK